MSDTRGRIGISVLLGGILVAGLIITVNFWTSDPSPFVMAQSTATTTLTVLNTPPLWTVDAQSAVSYTSTSPAFVGSNVQWNAIGTSPNNNSYYLLICKTSSTPTANNGTSPTCNGGAGNLWTVSSSTTSGTNATSTYVASSTDPQINAWFAWICDGDTFNAKCNTTFKQGTGNTASPFYLDHRPTFSSFTNNSPANPGASITWTALASSTQNFTGATNTVKLYVCKANDFTGAACGAGGTYCSSTTAFVNPTCAYNIPIPTQDQGYSSYGFIIDQFSFAASGGAEGTDATATVNDVAPTITSSSISLLNSNGSSTPLALTVPSGQTTGFQVKYTVSSNNSCSSTSGGQKITSSIFNVYRSGIGSSSCETAGNYNANNCYPAAIDTSTWNYSCSQDVGSCAGSNSITATWTCTFPLWYVADPTDGTLASTTQFIGQHWFTSVQATDDKGATSTLVESSQSNDVVSFLASQLNTPSINFGSLNSGSSTAALSTSTVLAATGNVGVNETLYGVSMCTAYPGCPVSTTSTIPVGQIQYASSAVAYGSGNALTTNPGALFKIQIQKPTATSTQTSGSTFWGVQVPSTIQVAGAYTGQNTFVSVESDARTW